MEKTHRGVLQSVGANIQSQKLACAEQNGACLQSQQMKTKVKWTGVLGELCQFEAILSYMRQLKQTNKQTSRVLVIY